MPIYQVTCNQSWLGQDIVNVLYYECADVLSAAQAQELADAIRDAWVDSGLASTDLDNSWSLQSIFYRRVDVAGLPSFLQTFTAGPLAGGVVGTPLPTQVALLISFTAPTVRPRNARTYLAGFTGGGIEQDGTWVAATLGRAGDWAEAVDSIVVTGDTLLRQAVHWDPATDVVTDWNRLQSYVARENPATQRRRKIGVGS